MNSEAQSNASVPRLSPETRLSLRELSEQIGERGHAVLWAANYQARHGELPSASQVIIGLDRDLDIQISPNSAARALRKLRLKPAP